jgi:AcrR family transcriptional regulator
MSKSSNELSTKDRIIHAAEHLFAEKGLDGASMRDITEAAGTNLASVNYHFGSKDGLIAAVFHRHLGPLNEARLAMLDSVEAAANGSPPSLEAVLDAFIRPSVTRAMESYDCKGAFLLLVNRCMSEPAKYIDKYIRPHFEPVMVRFDSSVARSLPHVPMDEIFWRMNFVVGALHHIIPLWNTMANLPFGPARLPDAEGIIKRLISFATAGLQANLVSQD